MAVESEQLILVSHKAHLYAMPERSSNAVWQWPPKDKSTYPLSDESQGTLSSAIDSLDTDAGTKSQLQQKLTDLRLAGPSIKELKDAVDAASAPDNPKNDLKQGIDTSIAFEKSALSNPEAIYGDIGLSADQKTAFVATFRGNLFALDTKTGFPRWVRDTGGELVGGVAVDGGTIYFGNKANRAFAWDANTAERIWSFETDGEVWATPTVDGADVYVTSLNGVAYKLDRSTGTQRWAFSGAKSGIASKPVVEGSSVFVGAFDNNLYALNTSDGSVSWTLKADNWFWATPAIKDGVVYAASLDGKVYAVDADTGALKWSYDTGSAVRSGPVLTIDGLVVASKNGNVGELDLDSGKPVEGSPLVLSTTILSDLSAKDATTVYISPTSATLLELDARAPLSAPGSTPLPR